MVGFIGISLQLQLILTANTLNSFWILLLTNLYEDRLTTLNDVCLSVSLSLSLEWTNPMHFITVTRPSQKAPCLIVDLFSVSSVSTKRVAISGQSFDSSKRVRCRETCFNNPLSSNGSFRHNIIHLYSQVLYMMQPSTLNYITLISVHW
jgi:hypothetical protein